VKRQAILALMAGILLAVSGWAADDRSQMEESFFQDPDSMVEAAPAQPTGAEMKPDAKTVGFSGEITSALADAFSRSLNADSLYAFTVCNIFLDARLPRDAKVFANVEGAFYSQNQLTAVALRELFLDFNFSRAVYFRAGKQVLQWGRCYLWNPTDLINIEKPRFIRKIGYREGAYGVKFHVPSGTGFNLYGFADTGSALAAEDAAGALKVEFLVGNFEMAFSGWGKKGYHPVWGYDFSTRMAGIDILGEASVSRGENHAKMQLDGDNQLTLAQDREAWVPRACLDISRSFRVGDFENRLTIVAEAFYNGSGYRDNVFADPAEYTFAPGSTMAAPGGPGAPAVIQRGTKRDFFALNNLHEFNYHSPWYAAVFGTFNRFILTDMSLNCNYVRNISDQSGILSLGVNYSELNGFTAGLLASAYLGEADREYTYAGQKYDVQLTVGFTF